MSAEFSIPINIAELPRAGISIRQTLDSAACSNIASRLAVDAVKNFLIDISVRQDGKSQSLTAVEGKIKATIVQRCSVTLEPIKTKISIPVLLTFAEKNNLAQTPEEIDMDEEDPPEPMHNGRFDLGDILVQILAVEVNPFPRKPGSSLEDISGKSLISDSGIKDHKSDHPFAMLSHLKDKLKSR